MKSATSRHQTKLSASTLRMTNNNRLYYWSVALLISSWPSNCSALVSDD